MAHTVNNERILFIPMDKIYKIMAEMIPARTNIFLPKVLEIGAIHFGGTPSL